VQAQWHFERRGGGPERLVLGLVEALVFERIFGDHGTRETQAGGALQLLDAGHQYPVYHITQVIEVRQTPAFAEWLAGLRDRAAVARINVRIPHLSLANLVDVRPVGAVVSELRIDHGPGYRAYLIHRGPQTVVLLCVGDKSTQDRDIERAKVLAKEGRNGP
jgi:putative addiction module killer protein